MIKHIPDEICELIYDILVEHTGAAEQYRYAFVNHYGSPDNPTKPSEFRCCSKWGMAGKFWWNNDRFYVSGRSRGECSSEQDHNMELAECDEVNKLLAPLYVQTYAIRLDANLDMSDAFHKIPKLEQYQGSLHDQLQMLIRVANRLGLQDAATFIQNSIDHE